MNGVEILASNKVIVESVFNWLLFWKTCGAILGFCLTLGIIGSLIDRDRNILFMGMLVGVLFGAFIGFIFGGADAIPTEYETQYKVTISDEILMNDFLEKYEIIEQDGKIYTVREIQ